MTDAAHPPDDGAAEELLRRALLDASDAAAVSLAVDGLPVSEAVTVVFHGRRDLGTIQTYVARGHRGAGETIAARELLRVPCDLDLGDAEDREEAARLYLEQATALRDALVGADTVLDVWREPLEALADGDVTVERSLAAAHAAAGASPASRRARGARAPPRRSPRSAARARSPPAGRRSGSPAPSRTSRASTRCPTTRSAASPSSRELAAEHARGLAARLERQEASVERFLELSGEEPPPPPL